ncbi:hypothetical protein SLA2020_381830 [Shorea laevis]
MRSPAGTTSSTRTSTSCTPRPRTQSPCPSPSYNLASHSLSKFFASATASPPSRSAPSGSTVYLHQARTVPHQARQPHVREDLDLDKSIERKRPAVTNATWVNVASSTRGQRERSRWEIERYRFQRSEY